MGKDNKIKIVSRILLIVSGVLLASSIFLPIWKIDLFAPQYPEGLKLQIFADSLGGDVEIINGLNHYIGMKTLHTDDFVEFTILPYLLGFFAAGFLGVGLLGRKIPVYILFTLFILFCIISMIDFYRWNYDYGHDLDPHAAIKVPGMAYQPPLIGFKQLLNFGAYSMPDIGGILMITAGLLSLFVLLLETNVIMKIFRKRHSAQISIAGVILLLASCNASGPEPLQLNEDMCAYCKMTVTDAQFATQLITVKGRNYIFDDIACMRDYVETNSVEYKSFYITDFASSHDFINLDQAVLLHSDSLRSPMGGNIAGFAFRDSLEKYQVRFGGEIVHWPDLKTAE